MRNNYFFIIINKIFKLFFLIKTKMMKNTIIAISGEFCSGKDTLAKYFEENFGFKYINVTNFFKNSQLIP